MSLEIFLLLLLAASILTGLVTQGIKNLLTEWKMNYYANTLAGIVAVTISAGLGTVYAIFTETIWNEKMAVILIALIFLSWLCSMVGYDKVKQAIEQIFPFGIS